MNLTPELRGDPTTLIQNPHSRQWTFQKREDGTPAGPGYFGEIATKEDPDLYATELPTQVFGVRGAFSHLIPVIVPTLTAQEIVHLVIGGRPTWGIIEKAKRHAELRISQRKSVFAELGEQGILPTSDIGMTVQE